MENEMKRESPREAAAGRPQAARNSTARLPSEDASAAGDVVTNAAAPDARQRRGGALGLVVLLALAGGSYGYACLTDAARDLESHARPEDAEAAIRALDHLGHWCERIQAGHAADSVSPVVGKI